MGKLHTYVPAAAIVTLLAAGGCASRGDVDQLRSEVAGLRSSVAAADARAAAAEAEAQRAAAEAQAASDQPLEGGRGPGLPAEPAEVEPPFRR